MNTKHFYDGSIWKPQFKEVSRSKDKAAFTREEFATGLANLRILVNDVVESSYRKEEADDHFNLRQLNDGVTRARIFAAPHLPVEDEAFYAKVDADELYYGFGKLERKGSPVLNSIDSEVSVLALEFLTRHTNAFHTCTREELALHVHKYFGFEPEERSFGRRINDLVNANLGVVMAEDGTYYFDIKAVTGRYEVHPGCENCNSEKSAVGLYILQFLKDHEGNCKTYTAQQILTALRCKGIATSLNTVKRELATLDRLRIGVRANADYTGYLYYDEYFSHITWFTRIQPMAYMSRNTVPLYKLDACKAVKAAPAITPAAAAASAAKAA